MTAGPKLLVVVLMTLALAVVTVPPAAAQSDPAPSSTTSTMPESQGIIPEPNVGVSPQDAGDRGGALQTTVFVLMLAGVGAIGWRVVRESRRVRAGRGF